VIHRAYLGIDPGASKTSPGAVALMCGFEIDVRDWEGLHEMREQLAIWMMLYDIDKAGLEAVHAMSYLTRDRVSGDVYMKSQKGSANFDFGTNFGMWQGLLAGLGIEYELVSPNIWMSSYNMPKKEKKSDKPALPIARNMFPGAPLKLKKHHGRADALLIANWMRQRYGRPLR